MPFIETGIPGLQVFEPHLLRDHRGYFYESYNERLFHDHGITDHFVQDNQARSGYGTIRGLHYQLNPMAQSKLVRVTEGSVLDVAVDLRTGSPTYGKAFSIVLSAEAKNQLYVPRGFAHGYSVLSETAEFLYKCDSFYSREHERGISFQDPALRIDWRIPESKRLLSEKDLLHPVLEAADKNFIFTQPAQRP